MTVSIDKSSGFCWGVIRTIAIAEEHLAKGEKLYSLGEVIHNPVEIERLKQKGLEIISHFDLNKMKGKKVLIRAHGEPPSTFDMAAKLGITLIDATCPVVAKVQERIRRFYDDGYQIVIFGKKDHAEVIGLLGQTNGEAIIIKSIDEIYKISLNRKTVLFSQTTMDKPTFYLIKEELAHKIEKLIIASIEETAVEFQAKDTICGQVSGREKKIREFAASNELIIFVAGRYSSNGKVLFDIVRSVNTNTYLIEKTDELKIEWFYGVEKVGITGATSTPHWLMQQVKNEIELITDKNNFQNKFIQPSIISESIHNNL